MLGSFIIFLGVFLLANVGMIVYMYVTYPGGEIDALKGELKKTISYYDPQDDNSISRRFWDAFQSELRCCGASSVWDWSEMNDQLKGPNKVPASCCNGQNSNCVIKPSIDNGGYMEGCVDKIAFFYQIAFWSVPGFMALMLIFATIVCSKSGREASADYERAPNSARPRRTTRQPSRVEMAYEDGDQPGNWEFSRGGESSPGRQSAPPYNPSAPPYNPASGSAYSGGHRGGVDAYPTGQIPYVQQPLMDQPPRYQDVASQPYRDGGYKIQYN